MKQRIFLILSLLALLAMACNLPVATTTAQPSAGSQGISYRLVTPDPNATVTPTPFQPADSTAVFQPTDMPTATPADTATPTETATSTQDPSQIPVPAGQVNILLLGSDWRPSSGYRTDVMMWVALNTKNGTASVISFPRDLYVTIPGWMDQRLNTAMAHGGFSLMQDTLEYNFGIRPDHYVMTNFDGFKGIINTLGGINVYAAQTLTDKCDLPQAQGGYCTVGPGWETMDGDEALWYVRSRYSSSDFDRLRRAQEVVAGIFVKLMNLNAVTRAPELFGMFSSSVDTDLNLVDVISLMPTATKLLEGDNIRRYAVTYDMTTTVWVDGQGQVQAPHYDQIDAMLREALSQ